MIELFVDLLGFILLIVGYLNFGKRSVYIRPDGINEKPAYRFSIICLVLGFAIIILSMYFFHLKNPIQSKTEDNNYPVKTNPQIPKEVTAPKKHTGKETKRDTINNLTPMDSQKQPSLYPIKTKYSVPQIDTSKAVKREIVIPIKTTSAPQSPIVKMGHLPQHTVLDFNDSDHSTFNKSDKNALLKNKNAIQYCRKAKLTLNTSITGLDNTQKEQLQRSIIAPVISFLKKQSPYIAIEFNGFKYDPTVAYRLIITYE